MRTAAYLLVCGLFVLAGCEEQNFTKQAENEKFQIQKENHQLKLQLEKTTEENKQLSSQIETLAKLPSGKRLDGLGKLKSIGITRYTNFYDKDKDGQKEKLIVYIQPVDAQGDVVKAAGSVEVELWDLQKDTGAQLAKWQIKAAELKKMWFGKVMTSNYRLVFDIKDIVKSFDRPLTVKVVFTDYVFGKTFTEQYLIKP